MSRTEEQQNEGVIGKLSETYPIKYEDTTSAPYFPAKERTVEYREGLYVGYRYFETAKVPVPFPFGFGLSYTTFEYSDLKVSDTEATFTLKNTGSMDGAEVVQLYVSAKNPTVYRPAKELKGFAKVFLKAGESKEVTIKQSLRSSLNKKMKSRASRRFTIYVIHFPRSLWSMEWTSRPSPPSSAMSPAAPH